MGKIIALILHLHNDHSFSKASGDVSSIIDAIRSQIGVVSSGPREERRTQRALSLDQADAKERRRREIQQQVMTYVGML